MRCPMSPPFRDSPYGTADRLAFLVASQRTCGPGNWAASSWVAAKASSRARALSALDVSRCAYVRSSIESEVPPKRATSVAGMPLASAQLKPLCLSVYGVVVSGNPAAPTAQANSLGRKLSSR